MTPSIVRRFAKYHGIDLTEWNEIRGRWDAKRSVAIEMFRRHLEPEYHHAVDVTAGLERVAAALTRIEDAEYLLSCGKGAFSSEWGRGCREAYSEVGVQLLAKANVDIDRWLKVTE